MINNIYAIFEGYYSDWRCIGYTYSEEEAVQICLNANKSSSVSFNNWYYIKVDEIKNNNPKIEVFYNYSVTIFKSKDSQSWTISEINLNWEEDNKTPYESKIVSDRTNNSLFIDRTITINLNLPKPDKEKAKKVAYDILYQYLAEKKEIAL